MIKNQIELEFGHGDIGIMPAKRNDGKKVALFFKNAEPGEVGRLVPAHDWDPRNAAVVMTFSNVKSIDVLINNLKNAKKMMKEKKK